MSTAARQSGYVSDVRQFARQLWEAYNGLRSLQAEWNAQDYGSTLQSEADGNNIGIEPADIGSVVFATADAIKTVMDAGHATNVTNIL